MHNLNDYLLLKKKTLEAYEALKSSGLLPVTVFDTAIDAAAIDDAIVNLEADRFVASVCGQIKAGKSMLINDLIFGAEVLPTADTPETATITEISYAEKSEYTVYFYTPEEWEALINAPAQVNGKETTYYEAVIKPAIEEAKRSYAKTPQLREALERKTARGAELTELRDFISVRGLFTPIVKTVRIKYPAEILKTVTIVDTPGINDPNAMRSRITEKWINRSDAVIFLFSAAQPFTSDDRRFFDRYLAPVPADKILTVVSKIDLVDDETQIKKFVRESLAKTLGAVGDTLACEERLHLVAPMFSLFKKLKAAAAAGKYKLTAERAHEIEYQLCERPRSSTALKKLIERDGYMPEFVNAFEKSLISSKDSILRSHIRKIEAVFDYHLRNISSEKESIAAAIAAAANAVETARTAAAVAAEERGRMSALKDDLNAAINQLNGFFNQRVERLASSIAEKVLKTVIATKSVPELTANLAFDAFTLTEEAFKELNREFDECVEAFKADALKLAARIDKSDTDTIVLLKNTVAQLFNKIDGVKVMLGVKNAINASLNEDTLKSLVATWMFFWVDEKKNEEKFRRKSHGRFYRRS